MCLVTKQKKPLTAKENIPIVKLVKISKGVIRSAFETSFIWEIDKAYKSNLVYDGVKDFYFDIIAWSKYCGISKYIYVHQAFHSMSEKRFLYSAWMFKGAKGYIPKGALYFKDETGLYASDKLVLTKIIKKK